MNKVRSKIFIYLIPCLAIATILLVIASVFGTIAKAYIDSYWLHRFIRIFDLNTELNVPSVFSTFLIMLCSAALAANAQYSSRVDRLRWYTLSIIFIFLASDELLSIHERLTIPVRSLLHTSGLFYFAWIIPYGAGLLLGAIFYLPFLYRLPKRIRTRMLLAGAIYLGGAIVVESFEGAYLERQNNVQDIWFELFTAIEETLEMSGMIVFLNALMAHLGVTVMKERSTHSENIKVQPVAELRH